MEMGHEKGRPRPPCADLVSAQPLIGRCRIGIYEGIDFSLAGTAIDKRLQCILDCHMAGNCGRLLCSEFSRLLGCLCQILRIDIAPGLTGGLGCLLGGNAGYIGSLD